jgi:hypothetical protein
MRREIYQNKLSSLYSSHLMKPLTIGFTRMGHVFAFGDATKAKAMTQGWTAFG